MLSNNNLNITLLERCKHFVLCKDNQFYHLTSGTGITVNWPTYIEGIILVASELKSVKQSITLSLLSMDDGGTMNLPKGKKEIEN